MLSKFENVKILEVIKKEKFYNHHELLELIFKRDKCYRDIQDLENQENQLQIELNDKRRKIQVKRKYIQQFWRTLPEETSNSRTSIRSDQIMQQQELLWMKFMQLWNEEDEEESQIRSLQSSSRENDLKIREAIIWIERKLQEVEDEEIRQYLLKKKKLFQQMIQDESIDMTQSQILRFQDLLEQLQ